jgi:hypothetical protein
MIEMETKRLILNGISWNDLSDIHRFHTLRKISVAEK